MGQHLAVNAMIFYLKRHIETSSLETECLYIRYRYTDIKIDRIYRMEASFISQCLSIVYFYRLVEIVLSFEVVMTKTRCIRYLFKLQDIGIVIIN